MEDVLPVMRTVFNDLLVRSEYTAVPIKNNFVNSNRQNFVKVTMLQLKMPENTSGYLFQLDWAQLFCLLCCLLMREREAGAY